jgi:hypothetical protein
LFTLKKSPGYYFSEKEHFFKFLELTLRSVKVENNALIILFSSFGTGKTGALEVLSKLCSRGWIALYTTPANHYRPLEDWSPTLFLD